MSESSSLSVQLASRSTGARPVQAWPSRSKSWVHDCPSESGLHVPMHAQGSPCRQPMHAAHWQAEFMQLLAVRQPEYFRLLNNTPSWAHLRPRRGCITTVVSWTLQPQQANKRLTDPEPRRQDAYNVPDRSSTSSSSSSTVKCLHAIRQRRPFVPPSATADSSAANATSIITLVARIEGQRNRVQQPVQLLRQRTACVVSIVDNSISSTGPDLIAHLRCPAGSPGFYSWSHKQPHGAGPTRQLNRQLKPQEEQQQQQSAEPLAETLQAQAHAPGPTRQFKAQEEEHQHMQTAETVKQHAQQGAQHSSDVVLTLDNSACVSASREVPQGRSQQVTGSTASNDDCNDSCILMPGPDPCHSQAGIASNAISIDVDQAAQTPEHVAAPLKLAVNLHAQKQSQAIVKSQQQQQQQKQKQQRGGAGKPHPDHGQLQQQQRACQIQQQVQGKQARLRQALKQRRQLHRQPGHVLQSTQRQQQQDLEQCLQTQPQKPVQDHVARYKELEAQVRPDAADQCQLAAAAAALNAALPSAQMLTECLEDNVKPVTIDIATGEQPQQQSAVAANTSTGTGHNCADSSSPDVATPGSGTSRPLSPLEPASKQAEPAHPQCPYTFSTDAASSSDGATRPASSLDSVGLQADPACQHECPVASGSTGQVTATIGLLASGYEVVSVNPEQLACGAHPYVLPGWRPPQSLGGACRVLHGTEARDGRQKGEERWSTGLCKPAALGYSGVQRPASREQRRVDRKQVAASMAAASSAAAAAAAEVLKKAQSGSFLPNRDAGEFSHLSARLSESLPWTPASSCGLTPTAPPLDTEGHPVQQQPARLASADCAATKLTTSFLGTFRPLSTSIGSAQPVSWWKPILPRHTPVVCGVHGPAVAQRGTSHLTAQRFTTARMRAARASVKAAPASVSSAAPLLSTAGSCPVPASIQQAAVTTSLQ